MEPVLIIDYFSFIMYGFFEYDFYKQTPMIDSYVVNIEFNLASDLKEIRFIDRRKKQENFELIPGDSILQIKYHHMNKYLYMPMPINSISFLDK